MIQVENLLPSSHYPNQKSQNTRMTTVGYVALGILAVCSVIIIAWTQIRLAAQFGTEALIKHTPRIIALPLTISGTTAWALHLLVKRKQHNEPVTLPVLPVAIHKEADHSAILSESAAVPEMLQHEITSPMPGIVCNLFKKAGDAVKKGEPLCVIECMKMECIIRAEQDGKITEIFIEKGASLAANQKLFFLDDRKNREQK